MRGPIPDVADVAQVVAVDAAVAVADEAALAAADVRWAMRAAADRAAGAPWATDLRDRLGARALHGRRAIVLHARPDPKAARRAKANSRYAQSGESRIGSHGRCLEQALPRLSAPRCNRGVTYDVDAQARQT